MIRVSELGKTEQMANIVFQLSWSLIPVLLLWDCWMYISKAQFSSYCCLLRAVSQWSPIGPKVKTWCFTACSPLQTDPRPPWQPPGQGSSSNCNEPLAELFTPLCTYWSHFPGMPFPLWAWWILSHPAQVSPSLDTFLHCLSWIQ